MKKIIIINKIVFFLFLNIVFFFNLESKSTLNVFLIRKVRSALSGDCILSGASLPGSRAEVVILSGPSIWLKDSRSRHFALEF